MYKYNLLDLPQSISNRTLRRSQSSQLKGKGTMSSSASQVSEQSSLSPEIKALRRNGPLNIRHATNPHLQPTLKRIFIELVKDYIPSGGFHRNSPVQAAYNFRLVCQAFHDASVPQFDETFFKVRQGTVGTESLQSWSTSQTQDSMNKSRCWYSIFSRLTGSRMELTIPTGERQSWLELLPPSGTSPSILTGSATL